MPRFTHTAKVLGNGHLRDFVTVGCLPPKYRGSRQVAAIGPRDEVQ